VVEFCKSFGLGAAVGSKVEGDKGTIDGTGGISEETMFALGSGETAETSDRESRRLSVGKGVGKTRGDLEVLSATLEGASDGNATGAGTGICGSTGSGRAGLGVTSWKTVVSTQNTRTNPYQCQDVSFNAIQRFLDFCASLCGLSEAKSTSEDKSRGSTVHSSRWWIEVVHLDNPE
jgi:hypothetical protein